MIASNTRLSSKCRFATIAAISWMASGCSLRERRSALGLRASEQVTCSYSGNDRQDDHGKTAVTNQRECRACRSVQNEQDDRH